MGFERSLYIPLAMILLVIGDSSPRRRRDLAVVAVRSSRRRVPSAVENANQRVELVAFADEIREVSVLDDIFVDEILGEFFLFSIGVRESTPRTPLETPNRRTASRSLFERGDIMPSFVVRTLLPYSVC